MSGLTRFHVFSACLLAFFSVVLGAAGAARAGEDPLFGALNPVKQADLLPNQPAVLLVGKGKVARVVVAADASATLRGAVSDLVGCVSEATGVTMQVTYLTAAAAAPGAKPAAPAEGKDVGEGAVIYIGNTPEAAGEMLVGSAMPIEGFTIKSMPGKVFIVGNDSPIRELTTVRSDGSAWGVYEFCERCLDVRFYWPSPRGTWTGVSIPKREEISVGPIWIEDAPVFRKREIWPSGGPAVAGSDIEAHHRRLRSADTWPQRVSVHAPHDWSKLYKESRPEIFQLRSDGKRDFSMLCYGNPRTLATYLEQIEAQAKPDAPGAPDAGAARIVHGPNITVSPNDLAVACRCDDCKRLWDEEGGQYGDASNILATFVQKLSVEVKKRWPDKTIVFLPYKNYTRPPRVGEFKFAGNVEVQICGMPGLAQYKEPEIDKSEQAAIDGWMRISGRKIQNWHYDCWPEDKTAAAYHYPHTIQAHYLANLDKTVGSFINGEKNHWARQNISLYIWLKTLWNPKYNVEGAIHEYCERMFGKAANTMRELVKMQCDGWEKSRWPEGRLSAGGIYNQSFPRADVVKMEALFAKAEKQVEGDALATERLAYVAPALKAFFAESKDYAEGTGRVTLDVIQTAEDPVIDGKLDDECWKKTEPALMVNGLDKEKPKARFPTEVRAVWTRQGVTFGFRMAEPTPEKLARTIGAESRDAALLWWDDNIELFLDVEGKRNDYYQWILNANGAIYDGHRKDAGWTGQGVRVATFVGKDFWSMEAYVPYAAFQPAPRPNTGTVWYGNFTRHRVLDRSDREVQRLNTTFAGPSNNESAFGPIRFIEH
ncbi:MAG: DUF4838 domain-containing protein [Planctomycetota bacterium]|nr:DUF4838 domain-containing protein [Planctomycetota bacterium]